MFITTLLVLLFMVLMKNIMHLVILMILLVLTAMVLMLKLNMMATMFIVMMGLIFLGGMSIIVSYICCTCPNYMLNPSASLGILLIFIPLSFKFNLINHSLSLPHSTYFIYWNGWGWLVILCLLLLLMLINTNFLNYYKASLRSL